MALKCTLEKIIYSIQTLDESMDPDLKIQAGYPKILVLSLYILYTLIVWHIPV